MTTFLERWRAALESIPVRIRESSAALAIALVATLAVGLAVGRWSAPGETVAAEPPPAPVEPVAKATDFESLVAADSPFETSRQGEQKRLVALQNTLAAAIAEFDGVAKASVFIAPRAATTGLGASASSRTASVHLTMDAGCRLDDDRVAAIARLVAGAETGLRPEAVAIVDGSGPRAGPADGDRLGVLERIVRERLATLLPEGTLPQVSVIAGAAGDGVAPVEVAISVPHDYFLAAHALAGGESGDLAAFRAAEAARLAEAARGSLIAAVDPAAVRLEACRVDWTYAAPSVVPATAFPWVRNAMLATLALAIVAATAVPLVRARRRGPIAPATVEPKPPAGDLEDLLRRDPARAAEAIDRWVRGGAS